MTLFKTYTGNAMLNNALMTIEVLAGIGNVSEITTEILLREFGNRKLWELNRRLKSYTMLFTKNGPLLNDAKLGEDIYKKLIQKILLHPENVGEFQCEVSGLWYSKSFEYWYSEVLKELNVPQIEIRKKDKTINRCWFPLIGALGSDAQALPQAKFDIRIHPVCIVAMQFLPMSALLYKGRILLFDAMNFDFAKDFIAKSVERVNEEIRITPPGEQINNIKDFDKGKYLLQAIELFSQKQMYYGDRYTDINLWSFTNSGTGASCEIDRVPGRVFRELYQLYCQADCQMDLKFILSGSYATSFINCLKNGSDYNGLYPRKDFEGVSVPFFEAYQKIINKANLLEYAKYISGLIAKANLTNAEEKVFSKTDAYSQSEYITIVQKILIEAAANGKWGLDNQLEILDDVENLPISSSFFGILKKTHFYFQKKVFGFEAIVKAGSKLENSMVGNICAFVIGLIEKDEKDRFIKHHKALSSSQENQTFNLEPILVRNAQLLSLAKVSAFIFTDNMTRNYGLNRLLRFYYSQKEKTIIPAAHLPDVEITGWQKKLEEFSVFYTNYYTEKYEADWGKFSKHVLKTFPRFPNEFQVWLNIAFENMNTHYKGKQFQMDKIVKYEETLCYDDEGKYNITFARFAVHFCLNQQLLNHKFKNQ